MYKLTDKRRRSTYFSVRVKRRWISERLYLPLRRAKTPAGKLRYRAALQNCKNNRSICKLCQAGFIFQAVCKTAQLHSQL